MTSTLRDMALRSLEGDPIILDAAREVSRLMDEAALGGAVVGGLAVVLHGHVRTTLDVDVYTPDAPRLSDTLRAHSFEFEPDRKQFVRRGVPIHLVTSVHIPTPPKRYEEIDGVRTVSLADLINIKLRSGHENMLRAQDLADVIALIRLHRLSGSFTRHVDKPLRPVFRELARAVRAEGGGGS